MEHSSDEKPPRLGHFQNPSLPKPEEILLADEFTCLEGKVLGSYQLLKKIGHGGTGHIFKAVHLRLGSLCCLKVLAQSTFPVKALLKQFLLEGQLLSRIDHPNLVKVFDLGWEEGYFYLVLEYIEGETLESLIQRTGPLSPKIAILLAKNVARGAHALHSLQQVIHRDIKPSNIMISSEGRVKLIDGGLAQSLRASSPGNFKEASGSPSYMPPEQFFGEASLQTDIYSLGITFYFLLCGKVPFEGTFSEIFHKHQQELLPVEGIPVYLRGILETMTAKHPKNRYSSMLELIDNLNRLPQENVKKATSGSTTRRFLSHCKNLLICGLSPK